MTVAQSPNQSVVAVGTNDGLVEVYKLNFTLVHGLHQVRNNHVLLTCHHRIIIFIEIS